MRMRAAILIVLSGCNAVFGIKDTQHEYLDARVDHPPSCPASGPIAFTRMPQQRYLQDCSQLTESLDGRLAIAMCKLTNDTAPPVICQSVDGAPFLPLGLEEMPTVQFSGPRLYPEGDELIVRSLSANALRHYHRGSDGTWTRDADLPLPAGISFTYWASTPTMGSPHRLVIATPGAAAHFYEIEEATPAWQMVAELPATLELGGTAQLTADGQRLVVGGSPPQLVSRSATGKLDSQSPLDLPQLLDPFLTADCGRLYFSAFSSVLYYSQQ